MVSNDFSLEHLYNIGTGAASVLNKSSGSSNVGFDGYTDGVFLDAELSSEMLNFIDTFENINKQYIDQKIRMMNKLKIHYGRCHESIESYCNSYIRSLEEAEPAEDTSKDVQATDEKKDDKEKEEKKGNIFVRMVKAIGNFIKNIFLKIKNGIINLWHKIKSKFGKKKKRIAELEGTVDELQKQKKEREDADAAAKAQAEADAKAAQAKAEADAAKKKTEDKFRQSNLDKKALRETSYDYDRAFKNSDYMKRIDSLQETCNKEIEKVFGSSKKYDYEYYAGVYCSKNGFNKAYINDFLFQINSTIQGCEKIAKSSNLNIEQQKENTKKMKEYTDKIVNMLKTGTGFDGNRLVRDDIELLKNLQQYNQSFGNSKNAEKYKETLYKMIFKMELKSNITYIDYKDRERYRDHVEKMDSNFNNWSLVGPTGESMNKAIDNCIKSIDSFNKSIEGGDFNSLYNNGGKVVVEALKIVSKILKFFNEILMLHTVLYKNTREIADIVGNAEIKVKK